MILTGLVLLSVGVAHAGETFEIPRRYLTAEEEAWVRSAHAAGVINGGGGKGVRCAGRGTETLDIYEARAIYGLRLEQLSNNEEEAFHIAIKRMALHFWNPDTIPLDLYAHDLQWFIKEKFLSKIRFLRPGQKLKPVNDAYEPIQEAGCETVQVALMYDESIILIDQDYWDEMDVLNRIALLMHEIIYFHFRLEGAKDSISTRKLVGYLFSTTPLRPKSDGIPLDRSKIMFCSGTAESAECLRLDFMAITPLSMDTPELKLFSMSWTGERHSLGHP